MRGPSITHECGLSRLTRHAHLPRGLRSMIVTSTARQMTAVGPARLGSPAAAARSAASRASPIVASRSVRLMGSGIPSQGMVSHPLPDILSGRVTAQRTGQRFVLNTAHDLYAGHGVVGDLEDLVVGRAEPPILPVTSPLRVPSGASDTAPRQPGSARHATAQSRVFAQHPPRCERAAHTDVPSCSTGLLMLSL
jgi:hypothetical protein